MSWATSCHGFGLRTPSGPAHQQDGGTGGGLVAYSKAGLGLGFHWPGAGDVEARLHQPDGHGVPGVVGAMGKHHYHDAVGFDDSMALSKDFVHLGLIILGS